VKNQYVGDVNDFVKYGLVRTLTTTGQQSSFVAWLLTPDDLSDDGRKLGYLDAPPEWRHRDPTLFDGLHRLIAEDARSVIAVADMGILPGAKFYTEIVPVGVTERSQHFTMLLHHASGQELVFFDPDNGLEIPSCPPGRQGSDKYLLWRELAETYQAGHSVLVYQHFPREARPAFVDRMTRRIAEATGACEVFAFQTSHVVFLLVPQRQEAEYYAERAQAIENQWEGLVVPLRVAVS